MTRGTTPTLVFTIVSDGLDLSTLTQVWVTIKDQSHKITYDINRVTIEDNTISVSMSQEETLTFSNSMLEVQIRMLDEDGNAFATPIKVLPLERILEGGVIE